MDLSGIWKVKYVPSFNDNGAFLQDAEDALKEEGLSEDMKTDLLTRYRFDDDGFIRSIVPIPESATKEDIDEAVASGKIELYGEGFYTQTWCPWKIENGKLMVPQDDEWVELNIIDGMIDVIAWRLARE